MIQFIFTKYAEKILRKLPKEIQARIEKKLKELKSHDDVHVFCKLIHLEPATHRIRIGDYRIILHLLNREESDYTFEVLDVGHRRDIYES